MKRFQLIPHGILMGKRVNVYVFPCACRALETVVALMRVHFSALKVIERNAAKPHELPQVADSRLFYLWVSSSRGKIRILRQ